MATTPRYPTLVVCCRDCEQAGDRNPPRLARFERHPDGTVELAPSGANRAIRRAARGETKLYPWMLPAPHQRPDGGVTWRLRCPRGHDRPVRHERLVAAFEGLPSGQDYARLCL
jgi:hypothetical protein